MGSVRYGIWSSNDHVPPIHNSTQTSYSSHMKTKPITFLLVLTFLLLFSGSFVVFADDLQDGLDAYNRKDYETAYKLFLPLAEHGDAEAQSVLGTMYVEGQGVPQDYKEAIKWYRLSAEQGLALGQYNLGSMYGNGQGVPQDYKEVVQWHRLSAEQGFALAQYNLGVSYRKGQGVPQDYKEAIKWYRLSAEQGFPFAQSNLGSMYYKGLGVPQDYVLAHMWWNIAGSNGVEIAIEKRNLLTKEMTKQQIEKAQEMARNWKPKK
jgi:uncharacterized protein